MKKRKNDNGESENAEIASPLVEHQLLDWHSDSSDDEGFQLVSHKKLKYIKKGSYYLC